MLKRSLKQAIPIKRSRLVVVFFPATLSHFLPLFPEVPRELEQKKKDANPPPLPLSPPPPKFEEESLKNHQCSKERLLLFFIELGSKEFESKLCHVSPRKAVFITSEHVWRIPYCSTPVGHIAVSPGRGRELVAIGREKKTKGETPMLIPSTFSPKKLFPEISISYVFKETGYCATCFKNSAYI